MNEIKIVIEGLNELTEAVRILATAAGARPVSVPVQADIPLQAQYQQPAQPSPGAAQVPLNYGQMPVQTVPVGQTGQQIAGNAATGGVLPTTTAVQGYTLEQLQVAAAGLTSSGKMPQVMGILQQFGIQAMTELPKERYGEFATALREAGAQI